MVPLPDAQDSTGHVQFRVTPGGSALSYRPGMSYYPRRPDRGRALAARESNESGMSATRSAGAAGRRLGLALIVIATAQLMVVLDTMIVNVALPHPAGGSGSPGPAWSGPAHLAGTGHRWPVAMLAREPAAVVLRSAGRPGAGQSALRDLPAPRTVPTGAVEMRRTARSLGWPDLPREPSSRVSGHAAALLPACLSGHRSVINGTFIGADSAQTTNTSEAVKVLTAVSAWPRVAMRHSRGPSRDVARWACPGLQGPRGPTIYRYRVGIMNT